LLRKGRGGPNFLGKKRRGHLISNLSARERENGFSSGVRRDLGIIVLILKVYLKKKSPSPSSWEKGEEDGGFRGEVVGGKEEDVSHPPPLLLRKGARKKKGDNLLPSPYRGGEGLVGRPQERAAPFSREEGRVRGKRSNPA